MTDTSPPSELLTMQEAADALGIHYNTARQWVRDGTLPAFKFGHKAYRVRREDINRLLAGKR